jgi:hypothetical protein
MTISRSTRIVGVICKAWNCEPKRRDGFWKQGGTRCRKPLRSEGKEGAVAYKAKPWLPDGQDEMQFAWEREAKENGDFIEG